jgi:hypothetical protein
MARIIAKRMEPRIPTILHPGQHCGVRERTILGATAKIRDAIAYAETTKTPLCILSLDFKNAFDNISHTYLYETLRGHGFSEGVIGQIQAMYRDATAAAQINGHGSRPFPIQCGIRQGCPLSTLLYAIALNPLLCMIDTKLAGIQIQQGAKTTILAYADDVTILLTAADEIQAIHTAIQCYQKASGATINIAKSSAMAIGGWKTTTKVMGIDYQDELQILGLTFNRNINSTLNSNWNTVVKK